MLWIEFNQAGPEERRDFIKENPENFAVCNGCSSILGANTHTCPRCHSYRPNPNPVVVILAADEIFTKIQNPHPHGQTIQPR